MTPKSADIIVIGAGGTGARVCALLPRLVRAGDRIVVMDGDEVEERNLLRQHFTPSDVGANKAEVCATRIIAGLPQALRDSVEVVAIPHHYTVRSLQQAEILPVLSRRQCPTTAQRCSPRVVLGCVDNPNARKAIMEQWTKVLRPGNDFSIGAAQGGMSRFRGGLFWEYYIDAGNVYSTGQVVLTIRQATVEMSGAAAERMNLGSGNPIKHSHFVYPGIFRHTPTLLEATPEDTQEACGLRVDTQSVGANQMAATIMASYLSAIIEGLPISSFYSEFSSQPARVTSAPVPLPTIQHPAGNTYEGRVIGRTHTWWEPCEVAPGRTP
jgi:hypothetical protein